MINSQKKGKRIELEMVKILKPIFPEVRRTGFLQAHNGGVDLEHTDPFNIEVKGGKQAVIKKIDKWREQTKEEGKPENMGLLMIRPERDSGYVILEMDDFIHILSLLKENKLI